MQQETHSGAPWDEADRPDSQQAAAQSGNKAGAVAEYSRVEAGLAELRKKYENVVFDLTTTKGDKEARSARKELVTTRTTLEALRKEHKAPLLAKAKLLDDEAKRITAEIVKLEKPIDDQIRADEARRESERLAREQAERERQARARDLLARIQRSIVEVAGASSEKIRAKIDEVSAVTISAEEFGDFADLALSTRDQVRANLEVLFTSALDAERRAEELRRQEEELRRQREELEAQRAAAEAEARRKQEEAERRQREEQERAAAEARAQAQAIANQKQVDAFSEEREEAIESANEQLSQIAEEQKAAREQFDDIFSTVMPEEEPAAPAPTPAPAPAPTPAPAPAPIVEPIAPRPMPRGVALSTVSGKPAENLPTAEQVVELVSLKFALRVDVARRLLVDLFGGAQ